MPRRRLKDGFVVALIVGVLALPGAASAASPNTITIGAATPGTKNCFPFGGFLADGGWGPNFAFVYKDIPAFALRPGDVVAFDLDFPNDTDNRMDVAMAGTTANGNDLNNGPFTTVADNAQTPANPRGDSTLSNYELQWIASSAFDFPGGGLLIRFSNPAGAFATDATCEPANIGGADTSADASGFFVGRRYLDADGVSPWPDGDDASIAQFRLILQPTSSAFTFGKVKRNKKKGTARLPVQVPGAGTLTLSGKGVKAKTAGARAERSVASAGTVELTIKPKGKLRKRLLARHKAKVKVKVTFAPSGLPGHQAGDPVTRATKVKLLRRR
jgi:hypothetical protein